MSTSSTSSKKLYTVELIIAWALVILPLLWGIDRTWSNVVKLFFSPPSAVTTSVPNTQAKGTAR
ncbi:MAG TPA: hypothetical protein VGZ00_01655 [Candidatus Baltobacteraceae bacterium]|jgi:hypothetical protein|nr:hypothetical protein [Candidatus Baltobacteraceae bacterium]